MFDYTRKITVSEIMSYNPCEAYPESRVAKLIGDGLTLAEILDAPVPDRDKLWLVLRPDIIAEKDLHELSCTFAERVAYINPDPRVQAAIDAKRAWLRGERTASDLKDARAAAYAAYAASAAYVAAARAASASDSARAACGAQVQDIRDMLWSKDVKNV